MLPSAEKLKEGLPDGQHKLEDLYSYHIPVASSKSKLERGSEAHIKEVRKKLGLAASINRALMMTRPPLKEFPLEAPHVLTITPEKFGLSTLDEIIREIKIREPEMVFFPAQRLVEDADLLRRIIGKGQPQHSWKDYEAGNAGANFDDFKSYVDTEHKTSEGQKLLKMMADIRALGSRLFGNDISAYWFNVSLCTSDGDPLLHNAHQNRILCVLDANHESPTLFAKGVSWQGDILSSSDVYQLNEKKHEIECDAVEALISGDKAGFHLAYIDLLNQASKVFELVLPKGLELFTAPKNYLTIFTLKDWVDPYQKHLKTKYLHIEPLADKKPRGKFIVDFES